MTSAIRSALAPGSRVEGYKVQVSADASASWSKYGDDLALRRMQKAGAHHHNGRPNHLGTGDRLDQFGRQQAQGDSRLSLLTITTEPAGGELGHEGTLDLILHARRQDRGQVEGLCNSRELDGVCLDEIDVMRMGPRHRAELVVNQKHCCVCGVEGGFVHSQLSI